ncbi:MAG: acyltransferase [Deltaproteobacteria bacterium]|nr:acyltransferase [Deltaproteobacteria bacterium]
MKSNVIIEQGVIFRNPHNVELDEFILLDKNVLLEAGSVRIGKRVHIAENCVISGGGEFIMEDYSCMAHSSAVVTASDTPNYGFRGSGPMVPWEQRSVKFGKVIIRKDAFVGMGVRILPDVTINSGAVIAAGAVVNKDVAAWKIVAGVPAKEIGNRESVKFPDI